MIAEGTVFDGVRAQPGGMRRGESPVMTAKLFRDAANVKNVRKQKTILGTDEEAADASVELVADHEWEALLHNFDQETDDLSNSADLDEREELWERLSSTRWLKPPVQEILPGSPNSETAALSPES